MNNGWNVYTNCTYFVMNILIMYVYSWNMKALYNNYMTIKYQCVRPITMDFMTGDSPTYHIDVVSKMII